MPNNFCVFEELVFLDLWILDSGFRIPNSGFRIPDSGFRIPDSGFRFPIPESGFRFPGFRVALKKKQFGVPVQVKSCVSKTVVLHL